MSLAAIILAAGKGTRMKSDLPKVLHEVSDRPMVAWVMDACRQAGCDKLIMVIGHQAHLVRETFADPDDVAWVEQTEQLGTGHAVMVCRDELARLDGPVLVVAGDGPLIQARTLADLIETHRSQGASCTLATSILPDPGSYGRILRDENDHLVGIVEAKDADERQKLIREVNVSLYCFDAQDLLGALDHLSNDNVKGEYYLTDTLGILRGQGKTLAAVAAVPPEDTLSINTVEELAEVDRLMRARLDGGGG
jgi:bifunctional UDP-N-acetylglucosamine pyrophosphorylase/glucosamine-1-phosphate N-acetyltransferase/UDP-N-acetylglucosamine pyrophosphorylase